MAEVTLTILHGADRGKVFRDIAPPVTIGREEGNTIQLNDERVSRCHLKIQDDNDRLVLTDLDSTNGTKVNGHESNLKILRSGDLISVGRSMLLVGTEEEIAARVAELQSNREMEGVDVTATRDIGSLEGSSALDFEVGERRSSGASFAGALGMMDLPEVPDQLTPSQAAQLCEILEYLHSRVKQLIENANVSAENQTVTLDFSVWQNILDLQARVGTLVRKTADPNWPE